MSQGMVGVQISGWLFFFCLVSFLLRFLLVGLTFGGFGFRFFFKLFLVLSCLLFLFFRSGVGFIAKWPWFLCILAEGGFRFRWLPLEEYSFRIKPQLLKLH